MSPQESTATDATPELRRPPLNHAIEELVALGQEASSPTAFLRAALAVVGRSLGAPAAVLEARLMSQVVSEFHSESTSQGDFWEKTVQSVLTDAMSDGGPRARLYRSKRSGGGIALLSAPLRGPEDVCSGTLLVVVACEGEDEAQRLLTSVSSLTFLTAMLVESLGKLKSGAARVDEGGVSQLRKVAQYTSPTELAFAITNKLRTRDGCEMVALAQVVGSRVEILSISGLDEVTRKSPGVRKLQAAMEECRDLASPVVAQKAAAPSGDAIVTGAKIHERWHQSVSGDAVASIPLVIEDEVVAILSIRRSSQTSFGGEDLEEFRKLVEPYAATLGLVERAGRSLARHALTSTNDALTKLAGKGHLGLKAMVFGPVLLALWLAFGSLTYEVTVPGQVALVDARQVSARQDGVLSRVHVVPGQVVRAGDVLCEFDVTEQRLERARLESEIEILEIQENRALAEDEPAELQLARANRAQLEANLRLIEHRIGSAILRAPSDGRVMTGDLRERVGDVFTKGEPLFQVAATGSWRLELAVPESEVSDVGDGMAGRFASLARPEDSYSFRIARVHPDAETREGQNVFLAEADVELDAAWIRSGMEGLAVVEVGDRAPWWVLFHELEDWVRLHLWL